MNSRRAGYEGEQVGAMLSKERVLVMNSRWAGYEAEQVGATVR